MVARLKERGKSKLLEDNRKMMTKTRVGLVGMEGKETDILGHALLAHWVK